jgi:hypothetical protein
LGDRDTHHHGKHDQAQDVGVPGRGEG